MATGTKKRRRSQSPARSTASKRAHVSTASIPSHSQHAEREAQSSRAGSTMDAYTTGVQDKPRALLTGEDWIFRVKFISSATDLDHDLFKNAVQGLVRICFPEDILDQLGPQVLRQHMREEKAPEENMRRMSEIFHDEMAQRMTSMAAAHLNTAAKIDSAIKAMLCTSARAFGEDLEENLLDHVIASLLRLKTRVPEYYSTDWLASNEAAKDSSDGYLSAGNVSDEVLVTPTKTKKHKKRNKKAQRVRSITPDDTPADAEMDIDLPATSNESRTSKSKDKKISSTWKWNIEAAELTDEGVAEAFPRTSDLFAYHALPIATRKLGLQTSRKEIRCEMQSLLDGMPQDEFEKWVESLQKLLNGDREMLARQEVTTPSVDLELSRVTPAPVDFRKKSGKRTKTPSGSSGRSKGRVSSNKDALEETSIKLEVSGGSGGKIEDLPNSRVTGATFAVRHSSTEARDTGRPLSSVEAADEQNHQDPQSSGDFDSAFGMPVLNLLWGSDSLNATECVSESVRIAQTIMSNLRHRISADRIVMSGLGGANKTRTMSELHDTIVRAFPKPGSHFGFMRIKKDIEAALVPWVIAEPNAFPELKAMPFIFAHTVPSVPVVLNLLFGSWPVVSQLSGSEMWNVILRALQRRGISEASVGAANIDCLQIDSLCDRFKHPEMTRRALLERIMRRLAFSHREKFPELKATPVVTTWERKTGLTW